MALAKNGNRVAFATSILKDTKGMMDYLSKETGIPTSKLIDVAFKMFYDKVITEGITVSIKCKKD